MGISLCDLVDDDHWFNVNFWNWRPIVELVRSLKVIDDDKAKALHEPFCGNGLTASEARHVADALETLVLPKLEEGERVLLDGSTTKEPDDFKFHRVEVEKNYSISPEVLRKFIAYCRACSGFEVL